MRRLDLGVAGYLSFSLLSLSSLLGAGILAFDNVLIEYAYAHALGLLAFAILNVATILVILLYRKRGFILAAIFAIVQLTSMIANLFIGAQFGVMGFTQQELTEYLLGTGRNIAEGYGFWKLSPYAYDALMGIQVPLLLASLASFRRKAPVSS